MRDSYTAIIKQRGRWWVGWIEEIPGVNCQEASKEELLKSLQTTLREALEFNRREALEAAGEDFEEQPIAL
jgi:predicted RNase H-like HicB family nuclease